MTALANVPKRDPRHGQRLAVGIGVFGMWMFLLSLAAFFAAGLVAVLVLAATSTQWPDRSELSLPLILWLSNVLIVLSSISIQMGLTAIRGNDAAGLTRLLAITLALAFGFLLTQGWSWLQLVEGNQRVDSNLFYWMFYVLSALHAAHLIGGIIPLTVCAVRAANARYDAAEHRGVRLTVMYWHFLGVIWLAMFVTLFALT